MGDVLIVAYAIVALLISFWYADVILSCFGRRQGFVMVPLVTLSWVAALALGLCWPLLFMYWLLRRQM